MAAWRSDFGDSGIASGAVPCKQAQHLSIAAWSFAKLGVASDELFEAIAQSLAGRAGELDPQCLKLKTQR